MRRIRLLAVSAVLVVAALWLWLPVSIFLVATTFIVVATLVWALTTRDPRSDRIRPLTGRHPRSDLIRRVDPASVDVSRATERWKAQWAEMISLMNPGDELWEFCTAPETWEQLRGRAGYAVVRNGVPTGLRIVTRVN
jgi:hypothetical protein